MEHVIQNVAMILLGLMCFLLGLRCGYRLLKSQIIPKQIIEEPVFQVIYIDPKIVRKMYGISEPKSGR
jgi:energy-converting hydrogenase Eha subunit F